MVVARKTTVWKTRACRTEIRENQDLNRVGVSLALLKFGVSVAFYATFSTDSAMPSC
jgi:hypothetical protein